MTTIVTTAVVVATVGWCTFFTLTQKGQEAEEKVMVRCCLSVARQGMHLRLVDLLSIHWPICLLTIFPCFLTCPSFSLPRFKEIINWVLFSLMDSQLSHKYTYCYHHHSYFLPFLPHFLEDLHSSSSCNTAKLTIQTNPVTIHPKTKQITAINFCILATHSSHTRPGASRYSSTFFPLFILL